MDRSTAQTLVRVYAAILFVIAAFTLIMGAVFAFFMPEIMMEMARDPEFTAEMQDLPAGAFSDMLGVMRIIIPSIMLVLAVVSVVAGIGLLRERNWARITAIVLAVFMLFSFPIGTAIGVFGLWLFVFNDEARALFTGKEPVKKTVRAKKR
jgi:hypothetical protein